MDDFYYDVVLPILIIVAIVLGVVFGVVILGIANSHWNCYGWSKQTGETTQVISGECYVKNGDKWEIFQTYVKNHHVDITEK